MAVTAVIELGNVFNPERRVTYSKHVHTPPPHVCIQDTHTPSIHVRLPLVWTRVRGHLHTQHVRWYLLHLDTWGMR